MQASKNKSFMDVLEERITQRKAPQTPPMSRDINQDPAHLAYLLGRISPPKTKNKTCGYKSYRNLQTTPPAPPIPHSLTPQQKSAVALFAKLGHELSPRFTARELKSGFRKLAREWHPDLCQRERQDRAHVQFIEIKAAFVVLSALRG